jgi:glycosyltransferase involved in cell wall biosynthesis
MAQMTRPDDSARPSASPGPSLRCSVVMPVFNEVQTIGAICGRVLRSPCVHELIVVDDASSDLSYEKLQEFVADYHGDIEVRVLRQDKNQGKGAALRRGFSEATGDLIIVQDADLEYDPRDYPTLIQPILDGEADVVYGSRFVGTPRRVLRFWHSLANKILTTLSNITTNLNLTDMETGYKAFRSSVLRSIPIRSNRFGFEPEITAKIARLGCRLYEVPISYRGRTYAEGKKIRLKDAFEALAVILKYWIISDTGGSEGRHAATPPSPREPRRSPAFASGAAEGSPGEDPVNCELPSSGVSSSSDGL